MRLNTLYKSLFAFSLLALATTSTASDMPGVVNSIGSVDKTESDGLERNYPPNEELREIYSEMVEGGLLVPGTGLLSPNLNSETLQEVYDYAVERGVVDDQSLFPAKPMLDSKQPDLGILGLQSKGASYLCLGAAFACAAEGGAARLSCAAARAAKGKNQTMDGLCAISVMTGFATCLETINECTHTDVPNVTHTTPLRGTKKGTETTRYCPGAVKIDRIKVFHNGSLVGRIDATCTDGTRLQFGRNSYHQAGTSVCPTDDGYLMQGLGTRVGSNVDAVRAICDRVGQNSNAAADAYGGWWGGAGGVEAEINCPEGQYMMGLSTWHDAGGLARRSYLYALQAHCR